MDIMFVKDHIILRTVVIMIWNIFFRLFRSDREINF